MAPGLPFGIDFLYFISGSILLFCAIEGALLMRLDGERCAWRFLMGFLFCQGVRLLWGADTFAFGSEIPVHLLQTIVESISLCSLFCFGLFFLLPPLHARRSSLILTPLVFIVPILSALLVGVSDALSFGGYALGACGGFLAAIKLPRREEMPSHHFTWLLILCLTAVLYCLLNALDLAIRRYRFFAFFDPRISMQVGMLAIVIALGTSLSVHQVLVYRKASAGTSGILPRVIAGGLYVLFPIIAAAGWLLTSSLGKNAEEQERADSLLHVRSVQATLESMTDGLMARTSTIARIPVVRGLLASPSPEGRGSVQEILDQSTTIAMPYAYFVADARGTIILSSNQSLSSTRVGWSVSREPFFLEARTMGTGRSYLNDEGGQVRSYYGASGIFTPGGDFLGMVAARTSVESLTTAFASMETCFLVDQAGTIFISRDPLLLGRKAWHVDRSAPMDGSRGEAPPDDGPHPPPVPDPLVIEEPIYGQAIGFLFGMPMLVTRVSAVPSGWSIVLFNPITAVPRERLVGIAATFVAILLICSFTIVAKIWLASTARVARSEILYRTLIESSPSWVMIVSPQGTIQFTNTLGPHVLGMEESEIVGRKLAAVFPAEHAFRIGSAVAAAYDGSNPLTEISVTARGGASSFWLLRAVPLRLGDVGQPATMLIGTDITESREAEQRLLRAERMAATGTFAAGIAHQFNNINTTILGYLDLLAAEQRIPQDLRGYAEEARSALDRAIGITARLLVLTEAHDEDVSAIPLEDMVRRSLEPMRSWLAQEGIRLAEHISDSLPVRMSMPHIDFILRALLSNAVHALHDRPVREVEVRTGSDHERAFLRVRDAGIGIPPDRINRVFTPFFTEKGEFAPAGSSQQGVRGIGLSLAVCHTIVSGHGGSIDVESTPGVGSTFTVWLPAASGGRSVPSSIQESAPP